jgi:hypothetical protein
MDQQLHEWHPTKTEVAKILREIRPVICRLAKRDQDAILAEVVRRKHLRSAV